MLYGRLLGGCHLDYQLHLVRVICGCGLDTCDIISYIPYMAFCFHCYALESGVFLINKGLE